ncbi:MAG: RnfABCDGE type electron transport complex subunit D [Treponema sp.]|nr:RnfABCDGE type electron transport complex subunit D [Treponema sp.]
MNELLYKKTIVRPFIYASASVGAVSLSMLMFLLLQVMMLFITKSYAALIVISAAVAGSLCADAANKAFRSSYTFSLPLSMVQGIIIGMLLPSLFPPITVFFLTFFTLLLSKYLTGGFANGWVNAAVVIVVLAWIIGINAFPAITATRDILQLKNPSYILIQSGTFPVLHFDSLVTDVLNNVIFHFANISIPDGYVSLLWDTQSVIPAFRFNLLTLLSSIFLFSSGMMSLLVPTCFVVSYSLLVRFAGPLFFGGITGQGDMLLALLTGGTFFFAVFVVQWYGTVPLTSWGKTIYGILCGMLAFLIAGCGTSSAGMVFAVLCANILSPLIQIAEEQKNRKALHALLENHAREQEKR